MSLSSIFSRERPAVSKISKQCIKHVPRTKFRKAKMPVFLGSILLVFVQALETAWQILTDGYVSTEVKIHLIATPGPLDSLNHRTIHRQAHASSTKRQPSERTGRMGPTKHGPNADLCKALFEIVSLVSFVSNRFFKMIGEMEVALLKMSDFFWVFFLA